MYLILEKGYRDVIDDDFWEVHVREGEELYTTYMYTGIGNDVVKMLLVRG